MIRLIPDGNNAGGAVRVAKGRVPVINAGIDKPQKNPAAVQIEEGLVSQLQNTGGIQAFRVQKRIEFWNCKISLGGNIRGIQIQRGVQDGVLPVHRLGKVFGKNDVSAKGNRFIVIDQTYVILGEDAFPGILREWAVGRE